MFLSRDSSKMVTSLSSSGTVDETSDASTAFPRAHARTTRHDTRHADTMPALVTMMAGKPTARAAAAELSTAQLRARRALRRRSRIATRRAEAPTSAVPMM